MADQTKKLAPVNDQNLMPMNPMLSTMPPPSQLPPRFFVPEVPAPVAESENKPESYEQEQEELLDPYANNQRLCFQIFLYIKFFYT